jgi:hypothetical protein
MIILLDVFAPSDFWEICKKLNLKSYSLDSGSTSHLPFLFSKYDQKWFIETGIK